MQKAPAGCSRGQVVDARETQNATSSGSNDTDVKEFTANPTASSPAMPVTTVTPVAKCPRTWRNRAWSRFPGAAEGVGVSIRPRYAPFRSFGQYERHPDRRRL